MERCPVCRARLQGQALCPRCGTDFSLALCARDEAGRLLACAVDAWARGDAACASRQAAAALALHRTPVAATLAALLRAAAPGDAAASPD